MNWTDEQRAAISTRGSLIVSAAAGAGKTAVLTERLCALISAGTDISRLLVLTFTRAAAAEMKNRIARRLLTLSAKADTDEGKRCLRAQAHAVTGANISTIHAFCARVIRRHGHALALSPKARIADEMEIAVLREQARDELLDALGEAERPDWHALLAAFGGEDAAYEAVQQAYAFVLAQPEPFAWLERAIAAYENPGALIGKAIAFAGRELKLVIDALRHAAQAVPAEWEGVRAVLDDDLSHARALLMQEAYEPYRAKLMDIRFETLRFPRGTEEGDKAAYKAPREAYKDCVKAQRARLWRPLAEEAEAMCGAAAVLKALLGVVRAYDEAFTAKKREKSLLDYNDLERLTLEALARPAIAAEYRDAFDCIAVDEYQDSNRVQEAILERVSRGDNLFLVGDIKQSIYRFRQAEPALFLEKLAAAETGGIGRIDLRANFRSSAAIIDCVNDTFSAIMSKEGGGIGYDARARLTPGSAGLPGAAELHVIERAAEGEEEEDAHDAVVEARFTAARVRTLMEEEPALRYKDIAVLLRSGTHALRFAGMLSKCGVPCYTQSSGGYFDAIEVQVFLNLLRVIDNQRRDVPLISVMRASIGGFDETALSRIRARHPDGSFYEAAMACAAEDDELGRRIAAFFAMLARYRRESLLLSIEQLIGRLLDETGYYEELGVLSGGAQRQANLDALLDKARAFESGGARGLYAFLRHVELAGRSGSFGAAQTAAADVVRILTIHKSKGLEFPVVFVSQLGAKFNISGNREALVLHGAEGAALRYIDDARRVQCDTAFRQTLLEQIRLEELAEEMRVLYVAMTRAKSRLILCGCLNKAAEKAARPPETPLPLMVLGAGSPLAWLMMGRRDSLPLTLHRRGAWLMDEERPPQASMPAEVPAITQALRARLVWRYPYAETLDLPAKAAISQLGHVQTLTFDPPAFAGGGAPSAMSIGTAMHTALQRLPRGALDSAAAAAFIQSLKARRLIGEAEADALDAEALRWFSHTPHYTRLCQSARAERELPFAYAVAADKLYDTQARERVLLQGVIDACYMDEDGWVLLDYKTDAPRADDTEEGLAARHKRQIDLYADALAALTHRPVKARVIVYLSLRKCVAC